MPESANRTATHPHPRARRAALGAAVVAVALSTAARGQEPPGPRVVLDLSAGALASDNYSGVADPSGTTTVAFGDVALGVESRTAREELSLRTGFRLEAGDFADEPDFDGGLTRPFAQLGYVRRGRDDTLRFSVRYQEEDIGTSDDVLDSDDLVLGGGTRQSSTVDLGFETGASAPLGLSATLRRSDRQFVDATDPTLNDALLLDAAARVSFRLNRTASVDVSVEYSERDESDAADTFETNNFYGLGLTQQTAGGLRATATAGYQTSEVRRTLDGDRITDTDERPVLRLDLAQERRNGTITAALGQDLRETGLQTDLTVGRNLVLPDGSLSARAGVAYAEDAEDLSLVGALDWARELPRGRLVLSLDQRIETEDDADFLQSTAGLSLAQDLTSLSALSLSVDVTAREALDDADGDRQRLRASVTYSYRLTQDWSLNTGYRHLSSRGSDVETITENEVFASIGRRFNLRP